MDSPLPPAVNLPAPVRVPSPEGPYRTQYSAEDPPTLAEELRRVTRILWRRAPTILVVTATTTMVALALVAGCHVSGVGCSWNHDRAARLPTEYGER